MPERLDNFEFLVLSFELVGPSTRPSALLPASSAGQAGQVFYFRFDNCNNAILVYAYILIYCRLAVLSGCVKVVV